MRLAALGLACAPLALLALGSLESKAYPMYPMGGYSESITCAATTTNLELREALDYPSYAHAAWSRRVITGQEAVTCDAMGNDWSLRKWLECPVR